jgi:subtilisin family serine protease
MATSADPRAHHVGGRYVIRSDNRDTGRSMSWPPGWPEYSLGDERYGAQVVEIACRYLSLAVVLVAVLAVASPARADVAPLSVAQTQRLEDEGVRDIIVKHRPDLSSSERADLRANADVTHLRNLVLRDAELVRAPTGQLVEAVRELSADPDVVYAEPNQPVQAASADPYWSLLWALDNTGQTVNGATGTAGDDVHAPGAWAQSTGTGQTLAVVDTGVESAAPDLEGQFATSSGETGTDSQGADRASNGVDDDGDGLVDDWRGWDFVDGDNAPGDENGHGSHVSGIVAALKDNDVGGVGIAPTAKVMALRVLGADGQGTAAAVASAFEYGGEQGVAVVNASLGSSGPSQAEEDAISSHPNTLYVVSAGNGGSDGVGDDNDQIGFWPCVLAEPNVVCVGATDANDQPASFSNYGATSVDLSAPGVNIVSTWINSAEATPRYSYASGTSMATAFVAGTLALMRARNPALGAVASKAELLASADQRASLAGKSVSTGRLNAAAAVLAASPVDSDGDGVPDNSDNCTQAANSDQADRDADGLGDACDPDRDGDGYPNGEDALPDDPSEHADGDSDGVGDHADNCPSAPNPAQADLDGDGLGDACDDAPNGTESTETGDGGANQTGGRRPTGS